MVHLIVSREYPPCPYPAGGIGTYVEHISRLLADGGDTVHVIAQRWPRAPKAIDVRMNGRLVIHRVALDEPLSHAPPEDAETLRSLQQSLVPAQAFSWQVARLMERLCRDEAIEVIEAQEYEAPLYHWLRRRRETPVPRVPVIVHLHTPSEYLLRFNDVDIDRPDHQMLLALEEYTIRAADALLCPSAYLAGVASVRYEIPAERMHVLPYPMGDTPRLTRNERIWTTGDICFVGRLEPRKGVKELVAAASSVFATDETARMSIVGMDASSWGTGSPSMLETLRRAIPTNLVSRFTFVGAVPRSQVGLQLRKARFAVVPSRFENFPNSCIEAMASGLPVLVSPSGGMAEMVTDGVTGWIAAGHDEYSLAATLSRALATPAAELARMGDMAAQSIRALCDNDAIRRAHIRLRQAVAQSPAGNSAGHADNASALESLERRLQTFAKQVTRQSRSNIRTMSLLDLVTAPPRQQLALLRRAVSDPAYPVLWLMWHLRRTVRMAGMWLSGNRRRGPQH